MKTCPKCGAENRQTASECRLCATPLESPGDLLEVRQDTAFPGELPPDRLVSGPEPSGQHAPASSYAGHNVCPKCATVNEPDWGFCQHCGTQLPGKRRESIVPGPQGGVGQLGPSSLGTPFVAGAKVEPRAPATRPERRSEVASAPGTPAPASDVQPGGQPLGSGPKTARTCPTCGVLVPPGLMYCANCGRTVSTEHETNGPGAAAPVVIPPSPAPVVSPTLPDVPFDVPVPKPQPERAVIQMITEGGQVGDVYELNAGELKIGRVEGDVKFPHDGYMSSQHARVVERDGRYFLVDEHSRNGTFIRIRDEVELSPGDTFLVGKQVFKFVTEK